MITFKDLLEEINKYNVNDNDIITRAYEYARKKHEGMKRKSGEEYIIHPLNVAMILAQMHADTNTICAALLHDTLEDTSATREEIEVLFNGEIAMLVDGVTKISKTNFTDKEEQNLANSRKIITSITEDVRIIIIKLADRLHNMRTLEYLSENKQKENAIETMEIFVPLAYYIGAHGIKKELEDISFRYLKPETYRKIAAQRIEIEEEAEAILSEMLQKIKTILNDNGIPNEIRARTKSIYGIYKAKSKGNRMLEIHDLLALKVIIEQIEACYIAMYLIHSEYHQIDSRFKDYICKPKTNMYQSLHTTVFGPNGRLVQTQIRTYEMDRVALSGLTSYWDTKGERASAAMQEDLESRSQFFRALTEIDDMFPDNKEFIDRIKSELFAEKIYVYASTGEVIELPEGSTLVDFAYAFDERVGNTMKAAYVNDRFEELNYVLKNKDRIIIITDKLSRGPKQEWEEIATTSLAKRRIRSISHP